LPFAFLDRASARKQSGDYDRVIQDYDQALKLTPNDAAAFYGRGWAYEHKSDYDRAIQDYNQALGSI
jgi:tetratricopeptide (TPR) repeat protein